jgi:hypothetical protein
VRPKQAATSSSREAPAENQQIVESNSRPSSVPEVTTTPRSARIQEEMRFKVLRALEQQPVRGVAG